MTLVTTTAAPPYELDRSRKAASLLSALNDLTAQHREKCEAYRRILDALPMPWQSATQLSEIPFLPVQLFKLAELSSVPPAEVFKVLASSGTTGQVPSRIVLDKETAQSQTRALSAIVQSFLGKRRRPMLIIDTRAVLNNRHALSARGAGILGFSTFGRDHHYLLDEAMEIDWPGLEAFLARNEGEPLFVFGFTFMVWQYFYQAARKAGKTLNLGDSILIHGGGWKKLKEEAVSGETFAASLKDQLGIGSVHDYYGMVEQVGSIYMQCEHGVLHAPDFSDVLVRDPVNLEPLPFGKQGLIQVLSILPKSYPGHSLLTEDLGTLLGEDDCPCGRLGKTFRVEGRLPAAELRGCSDTHAFGRGS